MKKFLLRLGLFSLPFWGLLAYLWVAPYGRDYAWNCLHKDCMTGDWIYKRLYENKRSVEVAFIGTSKTMMGIQDSLLEKLLTDAGRNDLHIANFGVCRPGVNMHYLVTKEVLQQKDPHILIVEVSEEFKRISHMHFPYLAEMNEIAGAPVFVNDHWLSDFYTALMARLQFHREKLLGIRREYEKILTNPDYSHLVTEGKTEDPKELARIKGRRQARGVKVRNESSAGWWMNLDDRFAMHYYRKIAELAAAEKLRLVFLYIPLYGTPYVTPREAEFYKSLGELWIPPSQLWEDPSLWFDIDHLNQPGSKLLTRWLADQLAGFEIPGR